MSRWKKILRNSMIGIGVFLLILITLPFLLKNKLVDLAKRQMNEQVHAVVDFDGVNISLLRSFPVLSLRFNNFTVQGMAPFEDVKLLHVPSLLLSLDIMTAIRGETIQVKKIHADGAHIRLLVLEDGFANWDIVKQSEAPTEATSGSYDLASLQSYLLTHASLSYEDYEMGMFWELDGVTHRGSGDFSSDRFLLSTQTKISDLSMYYGGVSWLKKANAEAAVDLEVQWDPFLLIFSDNELILNELLMTMEGQIGLPVDGVDLDLFINAKRSDFKSVLSMIPAIYQNNFEQIKTGGQVAAQARISGRYAPEQLLMPGFDISVKVDNADMQYQGFPVLAERIFFDLRLQSEGKRDYDDMRIDLNRASLVLAGQPITGKLSLRTPFTDPDFSLQAEGKLDLGRMVTMMPQEDGITLKGMMDILLSLKGRLSTLEQQRYQDFDATGHFSISKFIYTTTELPYDVAIDTMHMSITPRFLQMQSAKVRLGDSDISASGRLENYLLYALQNDTLKGSLAVKSPQINMNEWMSQVVSDTDEDTEMGVIELPERIDFVLDASVDKLLYDNLELSSVRGQVGIKNQTARMDGLEFDLLGGSVRMNGLYNVQNKYQPKMSFDFDIKEMDINAAANHFNTIAILAPLARRTTGRFSTGMSFSSDLDHNLRPVLSSVLSQGRLAATQIFVEGFEPLNELASRLQISRLAKQRIDDLKLIFKIQDGRVNVDPYNVMLGESKATIAGFTTLEQELFYKIYLQIPRSEFGSKANVAINRLLDEAERRGLKVDQLSHIMADIEVEGTITAPRFKISLSEEQRNLPSNIADQIKQLADHKIKEIRQDLEDKKDEIVDRVEEEIEDVRQRAQEELNRRADQVIREAERQANTIRREAREAAERIRVEGETQATRIEAEGSGNPLRQAAAKAAADKVRSESRRNADRLEQEAESRIERLLADARKEAERIRSGN